MIPRGMPMGMQAIGRHWEESLLLRTAYNAEQVVERKLPEDVTSGKLITHTTIR